MADATLSPSALGGPTSVPAGFELSALAPPASLTRRIDVPRVVARLRHIDASAEPALMFSQLSAVCVPAVCDEVSIDLAEDGGHRYRIRRPSSASGERPLRGAPALTALPGPVPDPELAADSVTVAVQSAQRGLAGPAFAGVVKCNWRDGYLPTPADGALIRLMVDHAVALVHRERTPDQHSLRSRVRKEEMGATAALRATAPLGATDLDGTAHLDGRAAGTRIDAAVGIVMAMHRLNHSQAFDLLVRISRRTRREIAELAETIVHMGVLPEPDPASRAPRS